MQSFTPIVFVMVILFGCGTNRGARWDGAMQRYYDNSSVRPSGPSRREWEQRDKDLLLRRLGHADVVVLGAATSVNLYTTNSSPKQLSVTLEPSRVIHGSIKGLTDPQGELVLRLKPGDEDFQTALRVFKHLPGSQYLLLLKHAPPGGSGKRKRPRLFWATYNPDARLLAEVDALFGSLRRNR